MKTVLRYQGNLKFLKKIPGDEVQSDIFLMQLFFILNRQKVANREAEFSVMVFYKKSFLLLTDKTIKYAFRNGRRSAGPAR